MFINFKYVMIYTYIGLTLKMEMHAPHTAQRTNKKIY